MASKSNLVDLEVYRHHYTEKAYLVSLTGSRDEAVWIPKSQCELAASSKAGVWELTLAEDLALDKGLI